MTPHDYPVDSADARERRDEEPTPNPTPPQRQHADRYGEVTTWGADPKDWPLDGVFGYSIGDWVKIERRSPNSPCPTVPAIVQVKGAVFTPHLSLHPELTLHPHSTLYSGHWMLQGKAMHGEHFAFRPDEAEKIKSCHPDHPNKTYFR
jgi:hypothetical protein